MQMISLNELSPELADDFETKHKELLGKWLSTHEGVMKIRFMSGIRALYQTAPETLVDTCLFSAVELIPNSEEFREITIALNQLESYIEERIEPLLDSLRSEKSEQIFVNAGEFLRTLH